LKAIIAEPVMCNKLNSVVQTPLGVIDDDHFFMHVAFVI